MLFESCPDYPDWVRPWLIDRHHRVRGPLLPGRKDRKFPETGHWHGPLAGKG